MTSLYQAKRIAPFHISVGAVVVNEEGKILVHKRNRENATEQFADNFTDRNEIYLLMRESLEDNETLKQAVLRGCREEFGVEGIVTKYLGDLQATIHAGGNDKAWEWQKTTLYFLVTWKGVLQERQQDNESFSVLEWHDPEFLLEHMRGQGGEERRDLDESEIIKRYLAYA